MLLFDRVSYRYNEKSETSFAVKEVSFSCRKGAINGIVGANGSGKSTILKLIAGLITPKSGKIDFTNSDSENTTARNSFRTGIIFQNPDNQIVGTTVEEDLAFGLENLALEYNEMHSRICRIAEQFNLAHLLKTPVEQLSGGQKQILCIASVMVMQPEWIVFDEPSSHLDPWARRSFWNIVKSIVSEKKIGIIVVSQIAEDFTMFDNITVLDNGSVFFSGPLKDFKTFSDIPSGLPVPESWKLERLQNP